MVRNDRSTVKVARPDVQAGPNQRAILRAAVVIALATIALAISLPDIRRVWQPAGTLGYAQSLDDVVISVTPGKRRSTRYQRELDELKFFPDLGSTNVM